VLSHPDEAGPILKRVAQSRKGDVRSWAAALAQKALPHPERVDFLRTLAADPWPLVREEAIAGIAEVDPETAKTYLPQIRRWLKSDERRTLGMVLLTGLRDSGALTDLRRIAAATNSRHTIGDWQASRSS
jgi:hypothetical protein